MMFLLCLDQFVYMDMQFFHLAEQKIRILEVKDDIRTSKELL